MAWLPPLILTYYNLGPESTFHAWIVLHYPAICLYSNCSTEHNFQVLLGMGHRGEPTPLSFFPTAFRRGCSNTPMSTPALLPLVVFSVYA